jgi:hypothetical protein
MESKKKRMKMMHCSASEPVGRVSPPAALVNSTGSSIKTYVFTMAIATAISTPSVSYLAQRFGEECRMSAWSTVQYHSQSCPIHIDGEIFNVVVEDGLTLITHPKWSIMGVAENLADAKKDLRLNAELVASEYLDEDDSALTDQAVNFKNFLIKYLV